VRVLAIDPGSAKCGLAVVEPGAILHREIVPTVQLIARVAELRAQFSPEVVLLGDGTQSKTLAPLLPKATLVPEAYTSQRARARLRHGLPWWRRLLLTDTPYDDLVAVILAEDWLAQQAVHSAGK
jgi:hypothetical protein